MTRTPVRLAALALTALPVLLVTAAPVQAAPKDSFSSRTSGFVATAQWVQYQEFDNPAFGNVHVGQLFAFETSTGLGSVFSFIDDFDCPPDTYPEVDGHGGSSNGCEYTGSRQLEGDVTMTVGRKAASARIAGTLTATTGGDPHSGEGSTTLGQVPVDITLTATSSPVKSTSTYRFREGGVSFSDSYRANRAEATVTGRLGPMMFEQAYQSSGTLETFTSTSRQRG